MKTWYFLLLFLIPLALNAQSEHLSYADSANSFGLSPISAELIIKNNIKWIEVHNFSDKDQFLFKRYNYNDAGSLVKQILYGQNEVVRLVDSFVYDQHNRMIEEHLATPLKKVSVSLFHYTSDSIINIATYTSGDSLFVVVYTDGKGHPIHRIMMDENRKITQQQYYTYNQNGTLATQKIINGKGRVLIYDRYEYTSSEKGRFIISRDIDSNTKTFQSIYNQHGQCIEATKDPLQFTQEENYFRYMSDGLLIEHKYIYQRMSLRGFDRVEHFRYYH